ncbi:MAG: class I SAM-dependent methyltransferase [Candidatus Hydrogenedentes bacterium]|nr:class I SAM-dependent methyltransferase [Candidatus Hydrogenedentota bacterium]
MKTGLDGIADFDAWAAYYDLIHKGLPGEAEFYLGQAVKRQVAVLEIGCGTGRITIPLAMSGIAVTGLDNSAEMLAVCREKSTQVGVVPGKITLVEGDMRDFSLGNTFPLVLMTYRTFMHCLTPADQSACLVCIFRHLEPGGEMFFNVWMAKTEGLLAFPTSYQEDSIRLLESVPVPGEEVVIDHLYTAWRDDFEQCIHERHWMEEKDEQGNLLQEEELTMTRAWFTPREMEHLLCRAGFEIIALLGDFEGEALAPHHAEMVWHVRRPKQ